MSDTPRPARQRVHRGGHACGSHRRPASSRVKTGPAARLLGELPAGRVQAIVTSPTRHELDRAPETLLPQLHRVLRADGTLWLLTAEKHLPDALVQRGWIPRDVDWATPLRVDPAGRARLYLLVKQPAFFYNARTAGLFLARRTRAALTRRTNRWRGCSWSPEHRRELMRLCILAGSSRVACGVCSAPYTRTPQGARRPMCAHDVPGGRCLILDPFCHPGAGAHEIAARLGRSFLGITRGGSR
jgi:hypothetical protein